MIGGIKTYGMDGKITTDPTIIHAHEGRDFFRKITGNEKEKSICRLLMEHPHKNIVKIYGIGEDYIDMELLNARIDEKEIGSVKTVMAEVKTYLQQLGVMYIDWKLDNVGIGEDGEYKLFDFDASGMIDVETGEWKKRPPEFFWSYNQAVIHGMKTPIEIDDYAFRIGFTIDS